MLHYFAYGSNMDSEQMKTRCPSSFGLLGVGVLKGWRFFINSRHVANITQSKNSKVYGLLFEINKDCLESLDRSEGYPKIYDRQELTIIFEGKKINAWVYIDSNSTRLGRPRSNCLERVVEAAENFKFPKDYIKHLKSFYIGNERG